ncbi:MSMEG_0568 family radical SAM protein [Haliangium ochraceum]|uniref:Radical SAM domain protein n=1 Tax=Haliangium ochraceum (strain DSM 14365 / JCM 11303 / SMP-2) TaxID=502025 RepID=D0LSL8_HALO1|nr:MSMEG_0568 family radical SAM protein [Haliangium ochraceum]ACY17240.1 Radical SAM domain protein [Haliangium ochraceum DSM 14365]
MSSTRKSDTPSASAPAPALLAELQALGVSDPDDAGASARRGGAGPSDHRALTFADRTVMVPVLSSRAQTSPYRLRVLSGGSRGQAHIERAGRVVARVHTTGRPRFYDLHTAEGVPYWKIALLHSRDVLASTVLQTCVRYTKQGDACQFCSIGDSLAGGRTLPRKRPEQLAEVAAAAVRLDGISQVVLTTGTPAAADRGAAHLAACCAAIRARVDVPIQVQCEPPDDLAWLARLREAGADAVGMHLEAVTPEVRARVLPGKARVPLAAYERAFRVALEHFGRGQVSTYILAGLGDTDRAIIAACERLAAMGVYPFVVPFTPLQGTPMAEVAPPDSGRMDELYRAVAAILAREGLSSRDAKAGCAKCGACSGLASHEKAAG